MNKKIFNNHLNLHMIKLENYKEYILIFLAILFIVLPYCFFGFDVSDLGYHLHEQQLAIAQNFLYFKHNPLWPLSNIIGGYYQLIYPNGGLLFIRFGGVIVYIITAIFTYKIFVGYLTRNAQKRFLSFTVIFSALLAVNQTYNGPLIMIHYYTFPMMMFVITTYYLLRSLKTLSITDTLISCLCVIILIISRASMAPFIIFQFYAAIILFNNEDNNSKKLFWIQLLISSLTLIAFSIYYLILIKPINSLESEYTIFMLLKIYLSHLSSLKFSLIACLVLFLMNYKFISTRFYNILLITGIGILLIFYSLSVYYYHFNIINDVIKFVNIQYLVVVVLLMLAKIIWLTLYAFYNKKIELISPFTLLILISLSFPFIINFGTNNGLHNFNSGSWLLTPLILIMMLKLKVNVKYQSFFYQLIIVASLLCVLKLYSAFYRENNITNLTSEINLPKSKFIYTSPIRAKLYSDMIIEAQKYIKSGDLVFTYDYNPMFYWVTNTKAIANMSWPHIHNLEFIKTELKEICIDKQLFPKLIVLSKIGLFNSDWSNKTQNINVLERDIPKAKYVYSLILKQCNPTKVWENSAFALYLPN